MRPHWLYASVLALLLSACGGGSNSGVTSSEVRDPPTSGPPAPSPDPSGPEVPSPPATGGDSGVPAPGPLTGLRLVNPTDIDADAHGNLYVVDGGELSGRIRRIAPDGSVATLVLEDGFAITALAVAPGGEVFYSKSDDPYGRVGAIWRIENGAPVRITSEVVAMSDIAYDPDSDNLYVGIWTPNGPEVLQVTREGRMSLVFSIDAFSGAPAAMSVHHGSLWLGWRDGPYGWRYFRWRPETGLEEIFLPIEYVAGMVATGEGIYIASYDVNRLPGPVGPTCTVDVLDPATLRLARIAGEQGSCNFGTSFFSAMTQASDGNLYLTEYFNQTIRKITPDGEISIYAGETSSGTN